MNANAYQHITDRIVNLLKQGTVPWHRPWKVSTGLPRNLVTRKPYRGVNVFMLVSQAYESPFWLTFHQSLALGGSVRKGERATPVVFWKPLKVAEEKSGEERKIPLLRLYHVFNVSQCDGLGEQATSSLPEEPGTKPDEIVANMPMRPQIKHGMAHAFYSPTDDFVGLPSRDRFTREDDYYSTLFHELIHSTGHSSRLKRAAVTDHAGFGSDPYSKEELVAEMGATFLCAKAEIIERTLDQSAGYIQQWLSKLENETTLIVQAAAQAQKATDFILGTSAGEFEAGNEIRDSIHTEMEVAA